MKKIFLFSLACVFLAAPASFAKDTQSDDAPALVRTSFINKYPNVAVKDWDWEDDVELYEAEFVMNGREYEAYFDKEGKWIKTKSEVKKEMVPAKISTALTTGEFRDGKAGDYYEMETPEGKHYSAKVKSGGLEYKVKLDSDGKVIEKKTKDEMKQDKKMNKY